MKELQELYDVISSRKGQDPDKSYSAKLLSHNEKIYRKLNEECYELIYACLKQNKNEVIYEACDVIYHLLTLLAKHDVSIEDITKELEARRK